MFDLDQAEQAAYVAVALTVENAAARHLREMRTQVAIHNAMERLGTRRRDIGASIATVCSQIRAYDAAQAEAIAASARANMQHVFDAINNFHKGQK